jgi:hypothetical protein
MKEDTSYSRLMLTCKQLYNESLLPLFSLDKFRLDTFDALYIFKGSCLMKRHSYRSSECVCRANCGIAKRSCSIQRPRYVSIRSVFAAGRPCWLMRLIVYAWDEEEAEELDAPLEGLVKQCGRGKH